MALRKSLFLLFCLFFMFSLSFADNSSQNDSLKTSSEKKKLRGTGETIAWLPGAIVYAPVKYTMLGCSKTVGYVIDTKIPEKIIDRLTTDDEKRGLRPTYAARTGYGVYLYQKDILCDVDKLTLTAKTADEGRQNYKILYENFPLFNHFRIDKLNFEYTNLADENFYGIGPYTIESNEFDYSMEVIDISSEFAYEIHHSRFDYETGVEISSVLPTRNDDEGEQSLPLHDYFTELTLPGSFDRAGLLKNRLSYTFDSRNSIGRPTKGQEIKVGYTLYNDMGESEFNFYKADLDFWFYQHLFQNRVLALRFASMITRDLGGDRIPFHALSEIGEDGTVRGYVRGRFRDRDKLLLSAEYRYPVWRFWNEHGLDFVVFSDLGYVSNDIFGDTVETKDFKHGMGIGARLWNLKGLSMTAAAGWTNESFRFHLLLN